MSASNTCEFFKNYFIVLLYLAYLYSKKWNVITMDWSAIANKINYFNVARSSVKIGIILGYFLTNLLKYKIVKPCDMHLIGHSVGAHIAGISGDTFFKATSQKIARITGWYATILKKKALFEISTI